MPQAAPLATAAEVPPAKPPSAEARPSRVHVALEYLGFDSAPERREYRLLVREGATLHRFVVAIPQAAFRDGRAQMQDGPGICYVRMLREVQAHGLDGPRDLLVSDEELAAYRTAHAPIARGRSKPPTPQHRAWPLPGRR